MELLLRLSAGARGPRSLRVDLVEDVTVGELADHLCDVAGVRQGLSIGGLPRDALVAEVGPESGSTVTLAEQREHLCDIGDKAPAMLHFRTEQSERTSRPHQLDYGRNDLGYVEIEVSDQVLITPRGDERVLVNGVRCIGAHRVVDGDLIVVLGVDASEAADERTNGPSEAPGPPVGSSSETDHDSWTASQCEAAFTVELIGQLTPPRCGPFVGHRSRHRHHDSFDPPTVEFPAPPEAARVPALPVMSAVVPLLLGAGLWAATRSAASAMFVVFSFVYVVAAGLEARREFRREAAFRVEQFDKGVERSLKQLEESHLSEARFLETNVPAPRGLSELIAERSIRVWERRHSDSMGGSLLVRLGTARRPGRARVSVPTHGRSDLLESLQDKVDEAVSTRLGVVLDMDHGGGLGIVGSGETATALARWVLMQLVALNGPDELAIRVASSLQRRAEWQWTAWLPHSRSASAAARQVNLVIVDGATENEVRQQIHGLRDDVTRFLWLTNSPSNLPGRVEQYLNLESPHSLVAASEDDQEIFNEQALESFVPDEASIDAVEAAARRMAAMIPDRVLEPERASDVGPSSLSELMSGTSIDDVNSLLGLWKDSMSTRTLSAPVARCGSSLLSLDIASDGPHALIAGMTGAGKSETLRTWLISIALKHSPRKVSFLLVDYKGGSAFGSLRDLPHTVGLITDLDHALAHRAMVSLRAELTRRERWLASVEAASLDDAWGHPDRPAALIVIVDEFATLAKEIPRFVDELVDVAQRGRSLGIHLVLATQRPHGVVSESIRANTSLRVALRVADSQDSIDVIGTPDAAEIDRSEPGSAIVAIGPARSAVVRFAYSSANPTAAPRISSRPLSIHHHVEPITVAGSSTELDIAVLTARDAFSRSGSKPPRRPWVAPLPSELSFSSIEALVTASEDEWNTDESMRFGESTNSDEPMASAKVVVGLVDRPERQRLDRFEIDLDASTGIVVFGCQGSGREQALATVAAALTAQLEGVRVYSIGRDIPFSSDSIDLADHERVLRVLRDAVRRLDGHPDPATSSIKAPSGSTLNGSRDRIAILIDDIALFERMFEPVNRGEALRLLERVSRDGSRVGLNVVVGASRRIDLDPSVAVGFITQIFLRVANEDEASLSGLPPEMADPHPPGRGMHGGNWIQFADPGLGYHPEARTVPVKHPVPRVPTSVDLHEVRYISRSRSDELSEPFCLPVGLDVDSLTPAWLDLSHCNGLVAGPRRSGRSTALVTIAESFRSNCEQSQAMAVILDPRSTDQSAHGTPWTFSITTEPHELEHATARLQTHLDAGGIALLAIEELPEILDGHNSASVEDFIDAMVLLSNQHRLRIVAAGEIDAMSRCYSPSAVRLRSGRTGLLLRPDPDTHGAILGAELERRDEIPRTAGSGFIVNGGQAKPVQVAALFTGS